MFQFHYFMIATYHKFNNLYFSKLSLYELFVLFSLKKIYILKIYSGYFSIFIYNDYIAI